MTLLLVAGCGSAGGQDGYTREATDAAAATPSGSATAPASSAASTAPPASATTTATATSTAPSSPAAKGVQGRWCPTDGSVSTSCLTVTRSTVKVDGGATSTLVDRTFTTDDGGTVYSFIDAPLGTYYPAGPALSLPKTFKGKDDPKQERIWNSQTGNLYLREVTGSAPPASSQKPAASTVKGFPAELQGEWCSKDGKTCFSLSKLRAENPDSFLSSKDKSADVPGATDFTLCYAPNAGKGECTTSASMFVTYFPEGTAWDCKSMGAKKFGFKACKPDYTSAHDTSQARLVIPPNHQHSAQYVDTPPMYRSAG